MSHKLIVDKKITQIGERIRGQIQYDIPYLVDRFEAFDLLFQKEQLNIQTLCHNLYKKIHNG